MTQEGDPLLERLRQSASGDAALRQLRRRYDILREDYETLLDRLTELEERMATPPTAEPQPRPVPSAIPSPQTVAESLASPLLRMRDEFLAAADGIQAIVLGLEELATVAFGQGRPRGSQSMPPERDFGESEPYVPASQPPPQRIDVEAHGKGFGELLDFQERLSKVEGVARVSISAIDNQHSMLVVELDEES